MIATRMIIGVFTFVVGLGLTATGALFLLDRGELPYQTVKLDAVQSVRTQLAANRRTLRAPYKIFFFGDSLASGEKGFLSPDRCIPNELWTKLRRDHRGKVPVDVGRILHSGLSIYSYYFLSDTVMELEPDAVVIEFNLFYLTDFWRGKDHADLSAYLPASNWPETLGLPLPAIGLTADRMVLNRSTAVAGLADPRLWLQREQARAAASYWQVAAAVQGLTGDASGLWFHEQIKNSAGTKMVLQNLKRSTPYLAGMLYGPALAGADASNPALRMLAQVVSRFRKAGIEVVVYVPPHNVEHLARIGMLDRGGLARTIAAIAEVATGKGAYFVDLHDSLPDSSFHDHMDHLKDEAPVVGSLVVAERLAETIGPRIPVVYAKID